VSWRNSDAWSPYPDRDQACIITCVRRGLVKQVVGVLADLAHRTAGDPEQAGDRVVDRLVPPFDQAVGEQQQGVAEPQAGHLLGVGDRGKSIAAGATDYVTKPMATEDLLTVMEVWLGSD
jgi:hypothetical protein